MTGHIRISKTIKYICVFLILTAAVCLTGCSESGAEAQARADIESMRSLQLDETMTEDLAAVIGEEGRTDLDAFLRKAGEFDLDIEGSKRSGDDGSTIVTARITTYCFGKAYLQTWNEYLEQEGSDEFDPAGFYRLLIRNLAAADEKKYSRKVEIVCTDPAGDDNWVTDAGSNYELRNAILGGMLGEISALADIGQ